MIKTVVLIFLTIFLGCSGTLPENGTVKVGQQFSITLETDWKSQTKWTLVNYDKSIITTVGSTYQLERDPNMMSQPAQNVFYFKALKTGETDLEFKLEKIWGTGDYGRETRHIIINP